MDHAIVLIQAYSQIDGFTMVEYPIIETIAAPKFYLLNVTSR